jgi:hypothetical protein
MWWWCPVQRRKFLFREISIVRNRIDKTAAKCSTQDRRQQREICQSSIEQQRAHGRQTSPNRRFDNKIDLQISASTLEIDISASEFISGLNLHDNQTCIVD